jgi:FtsH-binding integral membrane protein
MFKFEKESNAKNYLSPRIFLLYVADLGVVGFVATLTMALFGAVLEVVRPGLLFNHVSPQRVIWVLVIFGGFSLLKPRQAFSWWRTIIFLLLALSIGIFATLTAWKYFSSLENRLLLTATTGLAAIIVPVAALRLSSKSND